MKRISLFIAGLAFGLAINSGLAPSFTTPALAQAINYEAILTTLRSMQEDIGRMINLVEKHRDGIVHVGDEDVTLSAAQKTQIINRYNALKATLATKGAALQ